MVDLAALFDRDRYRNHGRRVGLLNYLLPQIEALG